MVQHISHFPPEKHFHSINTDLIAKVSILNSQNGETKDFCKDYLVRFRWVAMKMWADIENKQQED